MQKINSFVLKFQEGKWDIWHLISIIWKSFFEFICFHNAIENSDGSSLATIPPRPQEKWGGTVTFMKPCLSFCALFAREFNLICVFLKVKLILNCLLQNLDRFHFEVYSVWIAREVETFCFHMSVRSEKVWQDFFLSIFQNFSQFLRNSSLGRAFSQSRQT